MASGENFTPGPWKWVFSESSDSSYLVPTHHEDAEKYPSLCCVADDGSACGEYGATLDPNSPDAHLIAAAPEMYEALKSVLNSDMAMREEDEGNISPTLEIIRTVLAKARGEHD